MVGERWIGYGHEDKQYHVDKAARIECQEHAYENTAGNQEKFGLRSDSVFFGLLIEECDAFRLFQLAARDMGLGFYEHCVVLALDLPDSRIVRIENLPVLETSAGRGSTVGYAIAARCVLVKW